jgi:hypothetical protein
MGFLVDFTGDNNSLVALADSPFSLSAGGASAALPGAGAFFFPPLNIFFPMLNIFIKTMMLPPTTSPTHSPGRFSFEGSR